jgi:hypothetical protein
MEPFAKASAVGKNPLNEVLLFGKAEIVIKQIEIQLKYLLILLIGN